MIEIEGGTLLQSKHPIERAFIDVELIEIGFDFSKLGSHYIADVIMMGWERGEDFLNEPLTKVILPEVARLRHTTAARAERTMRYAIEDAWLHGDPERQAEFFPRELGDTGRPTVSQFYQNFARKAFPRLRKLLTCATESAR
jgi:hypothetical protein